jgi:hypothetical protein
MGQRGLAERHAKRRKEIRDRLLKTLPAGDPLLLRAAAR